MAIIKNCTCKHDSQDEFHGKQRRVFNKLEKEDSYKCTVCGSISKSK